MEGLEQVLVLVLMSERVRGLNVPTTYHHVSSFLTCHLSYPNNNKGLPSTPSSSSTKSASEFTTTSQFTASTLWSRLG